MGVVCRMYEVLSRPLGFLNGAIDYLSFFFKVVFPKLSSYKPKLNKAYLKLENILEGLVTSGKGVTHPHNTQL